MSDHRSKGKCWMNHMIYFMIYVFLFFNWNQENWEWGEKDTHTISWSTNVGSLMINLNLDSKFKLITAPFKIDRVSWRVPPHSFHNTVTSVDFSESHNRGGPQSTNKGSPTREGRVEPNIQMFWRSTAILKDFLKSDSTKGCAQVYTCKYIEKEFRQLTWKRWFPPLKPNTSFFPGPDNNQWRTRPWRKHRK